MPFVRSLAAFMLLAAAAGAAEPPEQALEKRVQKVIEAATPSVVSVVVSHDAYPVPAVPTKVPGTLGDYVPKAGAKNDRLDLARAETAADHSFGSGLVLDARKGMVLTPYHLIDGATKVYVRSSAGTGSYADIHAADAKSDLSVLRLIKPIDGLADAKLGTARFDPAPDGTPPNLRQGSFLVAVGHPLAAGYADGKPAASWGILSNIRRRAPAALRGEPAQNSLPLREYGSLMQTEARVAQDSSGASLLNLEGEVVGLSSAVAAVQGSEGAPGTAVPLDANYRRIVAVLSEGREVDYGFLGVSRSLDVGPGVGGGAFVNKVTPGCPAALAGLRPHDVVRKVDGRPVKDEHDLLLYIGAALAGSEAVLIVQRGGRTFECAVRLGKIPNDLPSIASVPPPSFHGLRVDYSSMLYVNLFRVGLELDPPPGVCLRPLEPGSPAEKKVKAAGEGLDQWIITRVDGKAVADPKAFAAAVASKASATLSFADPREPTRTVSVSLP